MWSGYLVTVKIAQVHFVSGYSFNGIMSQGFIVQRNIELIGWNSCRLREQRTCIEPTIALVLTWADVAEHNVAGAEDSNSSICQGGKWRHMVSPLSSHTAGRLVWSSDHLELEVLLFRLLSSSLITGR